MRKLATAALVLCGLSAGADAALIEYESRDIIEITDRGTLEATDHSLDFRFSVDSQTHKIKEFLVWSSLLEGDQVTHSDAQMHIGPEDQVVDVEFHGGGIDNGEHSLNVYVPFADVWMQGVDFGFDEIIYNLDLLSSTVMWIQTSWYEPGFLIHGFGLNKVESFSVPAPAPLGLMLLGLAAMGWHRRMN